MKLINASLFILVLLSLSSCTMPITFWLFNNTAHDITIITHEKEIAVKTGKYKETTGLDYEFSISTKFEISDYKARNIPLEHVHWTGWGPFTKRMFYVQLEADGKLWVLKAKTKLPVTNFIEQPNEFPLEPHT